MKDLQDTLSLRFRAERGCATGPICGNKNTDNSGIENDRQSCRYRSFVS